jgi:hypothetical protein
MINAQSGLGHMIRVAENSLRFDLMYVSLAAIAILGYAGDRAVRSGNHGSSHGSPEPAPAVLLPRDRARRLGGGGAQRALEQAALPSLTSVLNEVLAFFTSSAMLMEAWVSLSRALGGFALAALVGIVLGVIMGRSRTVAELPRPALLGHLRGAEARALPDLHLRLRHRQPVEGGAGVPRVPLSDRDHDRRRARAA